MRNTAPCILYATMKIQKRNPNAVFIVAPSDHWIEQEDELLLLLPATLISLIMCYSKLSC